MKNKKAAKIAYWTFTILMIILMLFSAVSGFTKNPDGEAMMQHIGYPMSVLRLLGVAKILGVIAILVPGYPRLKEWAYAGFVFDLTGALHAGLAVGDPLVQWSFVLFGLILIFGSYFLYHKIRKGNIVAPAVS